MARKRYTAEDVKRLRQSADMTQSEFAAAIGVAGFTTISRWETGASGVGYHGVALIRRWEEQRLAQDSRA